ncbi:MAG: hypothetical protein H5T98_06575 [Syntrophomonadaceae bacterium]|nr:hypothetical protein [Syntrophomonadaceae bacterium]
MSNGNIRFLNLTTLILALVVLLILLTPQITFRSEITPYILVAAPLVGALVLFIYLQKNSGNLSQSDEKKYKTSMITWVSLSILFFILYFIVLRLL